jgi:hypothetical protein
VAGEVQQRGAGRLGKPAQHLVVRAAALRGLGSVGEPADVSRTGVEGRLHLERLDARQRQFASRTGGVRITDHEAGIGERDGRTAGDLAQQPRRDRVREDRVLHCVPRPPADQPAGGVPRNE